MTETTLLPLELRRAGGDEHILTGMVVPYGRVSFKTEHARGERFMPGAFAGVIKSPGQVRLTDSHLPGMARRPVGVATEFHETRDGLLGTFRFYDTPEGRGAYENVAEQTYGGLSVGFMPRRERTGADGVREVHSAHLFHVSLVDEPAYADARILAVRAAVDAGVVDLFDDDDARIADALGRALASEQHRDDADVAPAAENAPDDGLDALCAKSWDLGAFQSGDDAVSLGIEYGSRSGSLPA